MKQNTIDDLNSSLTATGRATLSLLVCPSTPNHYLNPHNISKAAILRSKSLYN